ncbi:hypothetical protein ACHAXA_011479 [Cyclostephanos tholiformis]|uniref:Glycoside hydrolase family 5 domain-containing protein n=1 Tax=Cyclostephanos tholiformis TaxID=382380 RepID=A0ABD3SE79_9STRA
MSTTNDVTTTTIRPIVGIEDAIHVRGRRLYRSDGTRFLVRGIAFPAPPIDSSTSVVSSSSSNSNSHSNSRRYGYDPESWLAVLRQLRLDLDVEFNAVRLYRMHPDVVDYVDFFEGAAGLGIYVIVPLTSATGNGVLDRDVGPPDCYTRGLYDYGTSALSQYMRYPNVLAGVVGNEVMDTSFDSAACVRAYAMDMKSYMIDATSTTGTTRTRTGGGEMMGGGMDDGSSSMRPPSRVIPLIYASQDSSPVGPGTILDKDAALRLTTDYLTCVSSTSSGYDMDVYYDHAATTVRSPPTPPHPPPPPLARGGGPDDVTFGPAVDIMGINVESWCSSTQEYKTNRDGTPGPYYHLHEALVNVSVPIIFTEMGCPHSQYDRDDPIRRTPRGTRDWVDVDVVSRDMYDSWSGYVAYAYDGPSDFAMTSGGPWNGMDVLIPTADMYNFKMRVAGTVDGGAAGATTNTTTTNTKRGSPSGVDNDDSSSRFAYGPPPRRCDEVASELLSCCDVRVYDDGAMVSYRSDAGGAEAHDRHSSHLSRYAASAALAAFALYAIVRLGQWRSRHHPVGDDNARLHHANGDDGGAKYGAITLS